MAKQTKQELQQLIIDIDADLREEESKSNPDPLVIKKLEGNLNTVFQQYDAVTPVSPKPKKDTAKELTEQAETDPVGMAMSFIQGVNSGVIDSTIDLVPNVGNVLIESLNYLDRQFFQGTNQLPRAAKISEVVDMVSGTTTGFKPFETQKSQIEGEQPFGIGDVGVVGDTPAERVAGVAGQFTGGGASFAPLLKKLPMYADRTLQSLTKRESIVGGLSGTAAGSTAEVTDNIYMPLVAALATGVTAETAIIGHNARVKAMGEAKNVAKSVLTEEGRAAGAERRVSSVLIDNVSDPSEAISNIKNNRLFVQEVIPDADVTTLGLADDAALDAVLNVAVQDSPRIAKQVAQGAEQNTNKLLTVLEEAAPESATASPEKLVSLGVEETDSILALRSNMEAEADLARDALRALETNPAPNFRVEASSRELAEATKVAFQRAREVQDKVWKAVERTEKLDLKPLRAQLLKLQQDLSKKIGEPADRPAILDEVRKLGNKDNNTFAALEELRSTVLSKRRAANTAGNGSLATNYGEIEARIASFIDEAGTSPQYREAAAYTRAFRQLYYQGDLARILQNDASGAPKIEPDAALETIISAGGKGSAQVGRFTRAEGGEVTKYTVGEEGRPRIGTPIPAAEGLTAPIQVALRDMFYDVKDKAKFLKDYGPTFRLFPSLSLDLKTIQREIKVASQKVASLEGRTATALDEQKTSVAALIGGDPDRIISRLKNISAQDAKNLVTVMQKQGVDQGLQAIVMREFMRQMRVKGKKGYETGLNALNPILSSQTDPGMSILFNNVLTKQQQAALRRVDNVARIVLNTTAKTDSEAAVAMKQSPMGQKLLSTYIGAKTAGMTGARSNLILTSRIMGTVDKVMGNLTTQQTQAVLERALVDTEYLIKLLTPPTQKNLPTYEANLRSYLYVAGIDASEEEKEIRRKAVEK